MSAQNLQRWFYLYLLLVILGPLTTPPVLAKSTTPKMSVTLDAGHGGKDRGATFGQAEEAVITSHITQALEKLLRDDRRFDVYLTRSNDRWLSLEDRAHQHSRNRAEVFVSVHVNSSTDSKAKGAEFYFQNQLDPDEESMALAHKENEAGPSAEPQSQNAASVQNSAPREVATIVEDLRDSHRIWTSAELALALKENWTGFTKSAGNSVHQAPFFVLSHLPTPSVLVEVGYLTNFEERRDLLDPKVQKRIASDLHRGLVRYKERLDKQGPSF